MFVERYLNVQFKEAASFKDRAAKKFNPGLEPLPEGLSCFYLPVLRASETT